MKYDSTAKNLVFEHGIILSILGYEDDGMAMEKRKSAYLRLVFFWSNGTKRVFDLCSKRNFT